MSRLHNYRSKSRITPDQDPSDQSSQTKIFSLVTNKLQPKRAKIRNDADKRSSSSKIPSDLLTKQRHARQRWKRSRVIIVISTSNIPPSLQRFHKANSLSFSVFAPCFLLCWFCLSRRSPREQSCQYIDLPSMDSSFS